MGSKQEKTMPVPEMEEIHAQLPATLRFPIASAADLLAQLPQGRYTFRGKPIGRSKGVSRIPANLFPIASQSDFDSKISSLIQALPPARSG
jgi:hypothetical protein